MREFQFNDATRQGNKLRMALNGLSGGGKTWTALEIATAIAAVTGDRIGVIDTEHGSAGLYSPPFKFKHCKFDPPYNQEDLIACLAQAAHDGIGIIIGDSLSRFWSGQGGMLEEVDRIGARPRSGGNFGGGWKEMRPVENKMIEAILAYPGHVIMTMRVKTAYEVSPNANGQMAPSKIGLKPEQREGMEYEFGIVGDMDREQNMTISKSRCPELTGKVFKKPGADVAAIILAWLETFQAGKTANDYRAEALTPGVTWDQLRQIFMNAKEDQLLSAAILDGAGQLTTLGDLVVTLGEAAKTAQETVGRTPAALTEATAPQVFTPAPQNASAPAPAVPDAPPAPAQPVKKAEAAKPAVQAAPGPAPDTDGPKTAQDFADLAAKATSVDEATAILDQAATAKVMRHSVTIRGAGNGPLTEYFKFRIGVLADEAKAAERPAA